MPPLMSATSAYRGRFAPTPSGPLHIGSLVAALGSYLDAQVHQGEWLVRMEDVDTPRAVAGADTIILQQLKDHGLHYSGEVIYQSQRSDRYAEVLADLTALKKTYLCSCTRKQIKAAGPYYTGHCRTHGPTPGKATAVRFQNDHPVLMLTDREHGQVQLEPDFAAEDFVLKRRDGLFAYQLAVVVDDIDQGITHLVRGSDLLTASGWQMTLWQQLNPHLPKLCHLPLVLGPDGRKLSKQNHAPTLQHDRISEQLREALLHLGLATPPSTLKNGKALLNWGIEAWQNKRSASLMDACKLQ
ncbi:MAG: tRNA glutamyl-Q(34) synthetase GluQRS [Idiomarina sp.]